MHGSKRDRLKSAKQKLLGACMSENWTWGWAWLAETPKSGHTAMPRPRLTTNMQAVRQAGRQADRLEDEESRPDGEQGPGSLLAFPRMVTSGGGPASTRGIYLGAISSEDELVNISWVVDWSRRVPLFSY
ncbi:uncharacterized protein BO96DRAFT_468127 [Aspergillus niger CBS 101883]|uniref:uncharacterized protein n=1 Tax=Aspergillus lacticoffeatus (strain CBS 101883) TaxID=1450533 RepID=UPI000D7EBCF8|nr:uncharacterized protein BO96DRAFT_468127 [Aspergillus niger CBS 101883]PYH54081.1 hypothetical protein BO96DRAFT_468127 [Aspergillus niger CBS 101883]